MVKHVMPDMFVSPSVQERVLFPCGCHHIQTAIRPIKVININTETLLFTAPQLPAHAMKYEVEILSKGAECRYEYWFDIHGGHKQSLTLGVPVFTQRVHHEDSRQTKQNTCQIFSL